MSKIDMVSYVLTQGSLEQQSSVSSRSGKKLERVHEQKQAMYQREDELRAEQKAIKEELWDLQDDGGGIKFLRGLGSFFGLDNPEDHLQIAVQRLDVDQQKLQGELGRLSRVTDGAAKDVKQAMGKASSAIDDGKEATEDAAEAKRPARRGAATLGGQASVSEASLSAHGLATATADIASAISDSADSKLRQAIERQADEAHAALDLREDKLGAFGFVAIIGTIAGAVLGAFTGGAALAFAIAGLVYGVTVGTKAGVQGVKNHAAAGHQGESERASLLQDQSTGRIEMADRIEVRADASQRSVAQTQREIRKAARSMRG